MESGATATVAARPTCKKKKQPPLHEGLAFLLISGKLKPDAAILMAELVRTHTIPEQAQRGLVNAFVIYCANYAPTEEALIGAIVGMGHEWGLIEDVPQETTNTLTIEQASRLLSPATT